MLSHAFSDFRMLCLEIPERSECLAELRRLVQELPPAHLTTLEYVGRHLLRVTDQATSNMVRRHCAGGGGHEVFLLSTNLESAVL